MMLPETSNSCLKYIQTNFSINIGTGTWYIEQLNDLYPKTSAGNTRPIAASNSFVAQTRQYPPKLAQDLASGASDRNSNGNGDGDNDCNHDGKIKGKGDIDGDYVGNCNGASKRDGDNDKDGNSYENGPHWHCQ